MAQLLLIDDDPDTAFAFGQILRTAGHKLVTASSGRQGLDVLREEPVDLILSDLRLPDMSGLEVLRRLRSWHVPTAFVVVTASGSTKQAVAAMQMGAADFLEKPVFEEDLLRSVHQALANPYGDSRPLSADDEPDDHDAHESHAAARWARVLIPVIHSPADLRTIAAWSRVAFVSAGALRNWCHMAGVSPRCSLVFARLLRAVRLGQGGKNRPEDLLDVMDRRTLVGLLTLAGLDPRNKLPDSVDAFLRQQTLVRDPDALIEVKRALQARRVQTQPR